MSDTAAETPTLDLEAIELRANAAQDLYGTAPGYRDSVDEALSEDIPALIAEVKQLRAENACYADLTAEIEGFHRKIYGDEGADYPLVMKFCRIGADAESANHHSRLNEQMGKTNADLRSQLEFRTHQYKTAEGYQNAHLEELSQVRAENVCLRAVASAAAVLVGEHKAGVTLLD